MEYLIISLPFLICGFFHTSKMFLQNPMWFLMSLALKWHPRLSSWGALLHYNSSSNADHLFTAGPSTSVVSYNNTKDDVCSPLLFDKASYRHLTIQVYTPYPKRRTVSREEGQTVGGSRRGLLSILQSNIKLSNNCM